MVLADKVEVQLQVPWVQIQFSVQLLLPVVVEVVVLHKLLIHQEQVHQEVLHQVDHQVTVQVVVVQVLLLTQEDNQVVHTEMMDDQVLIQVQAAEAVVPAVMVMTDVEISAVAAVQVTQTLLQEVLLLEQQEAQQHQEHQAVMVQMEQQILVVQDHLLNTLTIKVVMLDQELQLYDIDIKHN